MSPNHIADCHALNVHEAHVGDEGKKYSQGMTVSIQRQIVCIEGPLFEELQKRADGHCMHFNSGLYFSEVNVPQT